MGIRFYCPNGHKLNVKEFQGGKKGICPFCGSRIEIPTESTRESSKHAEALNVPVPDATPQGPPATEPSPLPSPPVPTGPAISQPLPEPSAWPTAPASTAAPMPQQSAPGTAAGPAQAYGHPQTHGAGTLPPPAPAEQTPPDPLVEAGDVVWYVRPASGGQFGPAGADVMRSWIEEGRVSADSLVWHEGWRDWQEASEVFVQFSVAAKGLGAEPIGADVGSRASTLRNDRAAARRRSNTTQMVWVVGLILAVIILLGVFLLVISGSLANANDSHHLMSTPQWASARPYFSPQSWIHS